MLSINKNRIYVIIAIVIFVGGLFVWFLRTNAPASDSSAVKIVQIGEAVISVELATTAAQRTQGLSGRTLLAPDTGMLFVFNHPSNWGIWMKDMRFPIDVLWITDGLKVADIVEDLSPTGYPKIYAPKTSASYVLELPSGTVKRHGITIGQDVVME